MEGNEPGILAGLARYASLESGLFCLRTGLRGGVSGMDFAAGSFGGGSGAGGTDAGGGIEVPETSESVDGGRGGNWNEPDDARRALPIEEAPRDERRSVAMAQKYWDLSDDPKKVVGKYAVQEAFEEL